MLIVRAYSKGQFKELRVAVNSAIAFELKENRVQNKEPADGYLFIEVKHITEGTFYTKGGIIAIAALDGEPWRVDDSKESQDQEIIMITPVAGNPIVLGNKLSFLTVVNNNGADPVNVKSYLQTNSKLDVKLEGEISRIEFEEDTKIATIFVGDTMVFNIINPIFILRRGALTV